MNTGKAYSNAILFLILPFLNISEFIFFNLSFSTYLQHCPEYHLQDMEIVYE